MKKKFSYKDILYKSKRLTALALIVVFGTGLMVTAGMHDEIPVHDGDVLVDRTRRRTPPPKRPASWIPWRRSSLSKA